MYTNNETFFPDDVDERSNVPMFSEYTCTRSEVVDSNTNDDQGIEEPLRRRIRDLEALVHKQNVDLLEKEKLQRTLDSTIKRLSQVNTEKESILDGREEYYESMIFYKNQSEIKTKECDDLKDRFHHLQGLFVDSEKSRRKLENEMIVQQQELLLWKAKCKHMKGDQRTYTEREKRPPSADGCAELSLQNINGKQRSVEYPKRRKLCFVTTQTALPTCKNCKALFDNVESQNSECRFHRCDPQPLKAWKEKIEGLDGRMNASDVQAYKFWPCCGKYGLKNQPGCLKLRSHDIVEPENG